MDFIKNYLESLAGQFKSGIAREHAYRKCIQDLLYAFAPDITSTNEPARLKCGAPDLVLHKNNRPLGYIETKDIGKNLDSEEYKEQFERYKSALSNLIITDYIKFRFYKETQFVAEIDIAELRDEQVYPLKENYAGFESLLRNFCNFTGTVINNADELATLLAMKAKVLSHAIYNALSIASPDDNNTLSGQLESFQQYLIPDVDIRTFSDVYSQTLAYGMFVARYHHKNGKQFSRITAVDSIPKTHPFLRKLFGYIAGLDLDERIRWVVDELAAVLQAASIKIILEDFGKQTQSEDPTIHFYENFLAAYNPELRKDIGAFYTPQPVVSYIIQAVNDILKDEFNLSKGLADNTKITVKTKDKDGREKLDKVHKVQILDPATGTGTFLAETVRCIYAELVADGQQGAWNNYVAEDLLPRLHGFEILMAPYAMAHLKLDTILESSGYKFENEQRLGIYLTNALDEGFKKIERLPFAAWLSDEAAGANRIKKETPVMVVIGNPPYNNFLGVVSHFNETAYAKQLIEKYKSGLNDQKLNLDDDYIKFIALGQDFIEKNSDSCGILAYISNNSFLDGVTHRQMRKQLLETFDKIYILNLHGDSRKKEKAPDGSKDENVFKIMQGNSVNIFIKLPNKERKTSKTPSPVLSAQVFYADLFGRRQDKYDFLSSKKLKRTGYAKLDPVEPYYFFTPKNFRRQKKYDKGFSIAELFINFGTGIKTERDNVTTNFTESELKNIVRDFAELKESEITDKYRLYDSRDWSVARAKQDVLGHYNWAKYIKQIHYRPFDIRYIYYTGVSKGFIGTPGTKIAAEMQQDNVALLTTRHFPPNSPFNRVFVTRYMADIHAVSDQSIVFPLYIYPFGEKQPNFNAEVVEKIAGFIGKKVKPEKLFDYIYAVLHSPKYRKDYEEFLKIDFPKIPYPADNAEFERFAKYGEKLRKLHLLETVPKIKTQFSITGNNIVTDIKYANERVYINKEQYFGKVPETAWQFYIGGYQPAQKYLKDRKGRTLSFQEIEHYGQMIAVLLETERLMNELG
ncbi:DNA methyltransferase [Planctomycetales bacterium]|nr:DNA methyltransferase [Planctomycetales bacterium]